MSKQYLVTHTIEEAHPTDIFAIAATSNHLLSASGSSAIRIYSTNDADFSCAQILKGAHKLGCHHLATSKDGKKAASVGFGGEVKIWSFDNSGGQWEEGGSVKDGNKAGELWAIALSEDGAYMASTSFDGRVNLWNLAEKAGRIREYETKGSFGMAVDLTADGKFTASGHQNGCVYIFNNETGRMLHSLPGLVRPIRKVAFSPASKLLAAAGDARIIALYDVRSGEQVANLTGHQAWIFSLSWSFSGDYLLSGAWDGKAKVWSIDARTCVATHSETDKTVWSAIWLPKMSAMSNEMFAIAGANRSISIYREASGS